METETIDEEKLKSTVEGIYRTACDSVTFLDQGPNIWQEELEDTFDDVFETAVDSYDWTPKPHNESLVKKYRDKLINSLNILEDTLYDKNKAKETWIRSGVGSVVRHANNALAVFSLPLTGIRSLQTLSLVPKLAVVGAAIPLGVVGAAGVAYQSYACIAAEKKRLEERQTKRNKIRDKLINRPISFG